ncbi:MAG TPA: hypothetical protein VFQ55_13665 [Casimicrobiaceae bacterium]|nr:hypothetical protein [Casimicrobiaceae bacterium]
MYHRLRHETGIAGSDRRDPARRRAARDAMLELPLPGRDELHVGYGVQDREAWLATFDAASVRRALAAVP